MIKFVYIYIYIKIINTNSITMIRYNTILKKNNKDKKKSVLE